MIIGWGEIFGTVALILLIVTIIKHIRSAKT
jgi:hypothetical protein